MTKDDILRMAWQNGEPYEYTRGVIDGLEAAKRRSFHSVIPGSRPAVPVVEMDAIIAAAREALEEL